MATVTAPSWRTRFNENNVVQLLKAGVGEYSKDKLYQLGAALAYYAVFAMAPVLMIALSVVSLLFGQKAAEGYLLEMIEGAVGRQIGSAIQELLRYSHQAGGGIWTTIIGGGVLLFAATGMFGQIQEALNSIWDVKPKPGRGFLGTVKDRFWSFLAIMSLGLLLLLAVAVNAIMTMLSDFIHPSSIPGGLFLWQGLNIVLSAGYLTLLFAAIFKMLPDAQISWHDVWLGAAVTAVLFMVGNHLIGLYLKWSNMATTYGASGSLVLILVWVYYSSQIFLFGAELTHIHAQRDGKEVVPKPNAERCDAPSAHKTEQEKGECQPEEK